MAALPVHRRAPASVQRDLRPERVIDGAGDRVRMRELRRVAHQQLAQACAQALGRDIALDLAADGNADAAGFLRDDHRDRVGLFRDSDAGAMAGAELGGEQRIHGERQEAGGGGDAVLLQNDGAVMQRARWDGRALPAGRRRDARRARLRSRCRCAIRFRVQ